MTNYNSITKLKITKTIIIGKKTTTNNTKQND